jgi:hypothetical protein
VKISRLRKNIGMEWDLHMDLAWNLRTSTIDDRGSQLWMDELPYVLDQ